MLHGKPYRIFREEEDLSPLPKETEVVRTVSVPELSLSVQVLRQKTAQERLLLEELERYQSENQTDIRSPKEVEDAYCKNISIMHDYNDIKDITQILLGKLSYIRECTVTELYEEFGLDQTD